MDNKQMDFLKSKGFNFDDNGVATNASVRLGALTEWVNGLPSDKREEAATILVNIDELIRSEQIKHIK